MNKVFALFALSFLCIVSASMVSAGCGYGDHSDCEIDKTFVQGRIYFADTNQSVGNAHVTVTCNHDGTDYVRTTNSGSSGFFKGTYFVVFPQEKCIAGDTVTVSAVKSGSSGQEDGVVMNWVSHGPLDLDIALIDVPLVPEFGFYVGVLTLVSSVGVFFLVRKN